MLEDSKSAAACSNMEQRKLRSATQTQLQVSACAKEDGATASKELATGKATEHDMTQIHGMLIKILEDTGDLKEIRRSLCSVDTKLSSLISRMTEVEDRVSRLEDEQASMKANPGAIKADIQTLTDRLATAEDRSRRNNLRFVGIPEGAEKGDTIAFLNELISTALDIDPPPGGIEMDWAHRIGTRPTAGDQRSRTIIARFLRYKDCQNVMETARKKKRVVWSGKQVMIFPDYSRETQKKREAFIDCKRALHQRKMKFSMLYPARLRISIGGDSSHVFDNPEHVMDFIQGR